MTIERGHLRLIRGDGQLPHLYWPAEARVRPEARAQLSHLDATRWYPVLLVTEAEPFPYLWLDTADDDSPERVAATLLETRGEQRPV